MPYLGVFCVLKKSAPLNLSNCKFSQEKQKCINLESKMPYFIFVFFGARILKNYSDF